MNQAPNKLSFGDIIKIVLALVLVGYFGIVRIGGCISNYRKHAAQKAAEEKRIKEAEERVERERLERERTQFYRDLQESEPYLPRTADEVKYYRQYQEKRAKGL